MTTETRFVFICIKSRAKLKLASANAIKADKLSQVQTLERENGTEDDSPASPLAGQIMCVFLCV